ncbi:FAD-binding oxidoreductase [Reichenbachiella agarivorans]|uniref:FAD-binding oxidoreductase n=1 Tax=Reichenbachiella agarivorans TaxID=2979464 RepID=A0ABY6CNB2_9BACT|nr:FAD-dependent oxidoreductase [Reichenbachiella agarivorans]UXP30838.1 FAD-binding oxidoreductase [Reichenbachiella agarivorans]
MWSYWEQEYFIGKVDLLVIGSGIVGLSAAIEYAKANPQAKITVLEAGVLPSGASTKNAGFACYGSPTELLHDLSQESEEQVITRVKKRIKGLENLKSLLGEGNIGYENHGSYELFGSTQQDSFESTLSRLETLNKTLRNTLGFDPYHRDDQIVSSSGFQHTIGAISIQGEAQINTGLMMKNLIQLAQSLNIQIWNGIKVESMEESNSNININTVQGTISAQKCIVATNGFAKQLLPELDVKPARAQVLITQPIPNLKFKGTYHLDEGYYYFRNVGNRVLLGGGRNLDFEGETTYDMALNPHIQNQLDRLLCDQILPGTTYEIDQRWSGIMGTGQTREIILKTLSPHLIVAVRLGGMGIAIGSLIGREAAQLTQTG